MKTIVKAMGILLAMLLFQVSSFGGSGRINPDGTMDFSVNFRYVPTPADLARIQAELNVANNIICDATDGQARFGTITITAGSDREDQADIWIYAEDGRSGLTFWFNGSGFGRLGAHINLFQGGIDGGVIAHELGHLAFGLGDEYDEQCRWGGPCGIGPCFDPGAVNGQNNSLMQQDGIDQTELCVATNHDLRLGNGVTCPGARCGDPTGCTDPNCMNWWNSTTNRFEHSQQEIIHPGLSCWETIDQNYPAIFTPPAGLPQAAAPGGCGTPNYVINVTGSDIIMLFIDRSGSMSATVNGSDPASQTRMDFAKAAARAFVDLRAGTGAWVGLVSFDDIATLERGMTNLGIADADPLKTRIDGLSPRNMTAIGDALLAATFPFQQAELDAPARSRTAFLLSDGQNNSGADPRTAAASLESQGVRIFTIPVGDAADRSLLSDIAASTNAFMLEGGKGLELPPIYFELSARSKGEALVLERTPLMAMGRNPNSDGLKRRSDITISNPSNEAVDSISFQVERFVPRLNVMLSTRHSNVSTWAPNFELVGPNGERFTQNDKDVLAIDKYYVLIRLPNPAAGRWTLRMSSGNGLPQFSYAIAQTENPRPDLYADVIPRIQINTVQPVTINANVSYGADLDEGVTYSGQVKRPDGSVVPIVLTRNPITRNIESSFSNYSAKGIYEVQITANVASGAGLLEGESIFSGPAIPSPAINIEPFVRKTSTWFYLSAGSLPPCTTDDCDNNGIKNSEEGDGDPDGDGIPSYMDDDNDGDDVPDPRDGTNDTDGDGIKNFDDKDSDNDGIIDGRDPDNRVGAVDTRKRFFFSAHVGSAHPLGDLDTLADANIHAHADITFALRKNIAFKAMFGINQFTAETSSGISHPRYYNASANLMLSLPRPHNMKPYLQGGVGSYWAKNNNNYMGWNVGIGGNTALNSETIAAIGLDFHQMKVDKEPVRFLTAHIGILFR